MLPSLINGKSRLQNWVNIDFEAEDISTEKPADAFNFHSFYIKLNKKMQPKISDSCHVFERRCYSCPCTLLGRKKSYFLSAGCNFTSDDKYFQS